MKLIKGLIFVIAGALVMLAFPSVKASAASASIKFETEEEKYETGDEVTINLLLEGDVFLGNFEGYISYDEDLLEYSHGPACISGDDGLLKITDIVTESASNVRKYVLTFFAVAKGNAEISIVSNPEIYEYETGYLMSTSSKAIILTIDSAADSSDEAGLESLRVSPGSLNPVFAGDLYEYEVKVPYDTLNLIVSAIPASEAADVDISGNQKLVAGRNRVVITVTAENGDEQEYILYVYKAEETSEENEDDKGEETEATPVPTQPAGEEEIPVSYAMSFSAVKENEEVIISGSYSYKVRPVEDTEQIPAGYVKTNIIVNGVTLTAYAAKDEAQSEFLLLHLKPEDGEAGFYSYDRVEKTIQRYTGGKKTQGAADSESSVTAEDITQLAEDYDKNLNTMSILIAVLSGICAILLFGITKLFLKYRGSRDDELD